MTPRADGILLAQNVIINQLTGNPTFVEAFSEFRPPRLPFAIVFFAVVLLQDVERKIVMDVAVSQVDHQLWTARMTVLPPDSPVDPVVFAALGVGPLLVETEGNIVIDVKIEGRKVLSRAFPLVVSVQSETGPVPADI